MIDNSLLAVPTTAEVNPTGLTRIFASSAFLLTRIPVDTPIPTERFGLTSREIVSPSESP